MIKEKRQHDGGHFIICIFRSFERKLAAAHIFSLMCYSGFVVVTLCLSHWYHMILFLYVERGVLYLKG